MAETKKLIGQDYTTLFRSRGKRVVSIEGLAAADGTLHPVQQGVVAEQGFQCAFCMPGFVKIGRAHV